MRRKSWFFGLHADPPRPVRIILAVLPFLILIGIYLMASHIRLAENPHDKLLPSVSKITKAFHSVALVKDKRSESYLLWDDTLASLKRIGIGILISATVGFLLGLNMGLMPGISSLGLPFIIFIANVPPLSILPILFISFGVGELGKVMLIILGTFPLIARDIYLSVKQIPREMIVKALTLGASQAGVVYRVVYPQVIPRLIETVRLCLGAAWLFLIASEAIASQNGLGYRIFLVRRYLSMDVIILYVGWITFLAFIFDFTLKRWVQTRYPWYSREDTE